MLGLQGILPVNWSLTEHTTTLFHTATNSHVAYRGNIVNIYEACAKAQQLQSLLVSQHGHWSCGRPSRVAQLVGSGKSVGRRCWKGAVNNNYAANSIMSIRPALLTSKRKGKEIRWLLLWIEKENRRNGGG